MSRAAVQSRPRLTRRVLEDFTASSGHRVDADKGIIYGVKVLGLESDNRRRYTLAACQDALDLYEGLAVNIDHPLDANGNPRPTRQRSAYDRLGKLVNVRLESDGIRADFKVLKTHPMAARVLEAAADPALVDVFGFSHNAQGEGPTVDGVFVIERITEVRSVDLVADSATTKSLFEGRDMARKPKPKAGKGGRTRRRVQEYAGSAAEDEMMGDGGEPASPASDDGEVDYYDHLADAIGAILKDDGLSYEEKMDKVKACLKACLDEPEEETEEAEGEEGGEKEPRGEGEEKGEEDKEKKKTAEARELSARRLMDDAGLAGDKALLEALMELPTAAAQKKWVEREKARAAGKGGGRSTPRSQGPGHGRSLTEATDGLPLTADGKRIDPGKTLNWLRN